jgi:hypothetical protein
MNKLFWSKLFKMGWKYSKDVFTKTVVSLYNPNWVYILADNIIAELQQEEYITTLGNGFINHKHALPSYKRLVSICGPLQSTSTGGCTKRDEKESFKWTMFCKSFFTYEKGSRKHFSLEKEDNNKQKLMK